MKNLADTFNSLEDENRLRILALLLEVRELCVCDIIAVLQLPQSTVSRQLSTLKKAGWLTDRKEALWVYYSINSQLQPLQQSLLPVIHHFLRSSEVARSDLAALAKYNPEKCC
jgi:ArsR family transcriptional regulator, arsenate/arsenite/antimonite-responsive transcriptional repressor